jgi:tRNA G10  N-methylase Trm11
MLIPARALDISRRPNGLMVDPFAGSGTVAVAAQAKGMRFIACDLDKASVAVLVDRLSKN